MAKTRKPLFVAFDVEGVLISKNRFFFEAGKNLGISRLLKIVFAGFLYQVGAITLKAALKRSFMCLRGSKIEFLEQIADRIPLMPHVREVFNQLRAVGCKTALISSGLPDALVKRLANTVGADSGFGFEVGANSGTL